MTAAPLEQPGGRAADAARAQPGYILVVDDEPDIRRLVQEILEDEHYQVATAENAAAARAAFQQRRPDLILLDIWMPDTDGITLLKEWSRDGMLEAPVVMMSGHGTVETAVEATRLGAYDFIEKPVSMGKLLVTVERALENAHLKRENLHLRRAAEPAGFLIGKSPAMQQLRDHIERIARTDTWVLISGEPGSGRSAAARHLHHRSARRHRPCVEIGPPQDLTAQLFGAEPGGDPGGLEQAHGGTLILNEIGALDLAAQARLLKTLEEKRLARAGRAPVELDARLIATTGQDLQRACADGRFREDLFYRLNVVPLRIPPLREHREDVPALTNFYRDWMVDNEQLPYRRFTTGALNALRNHSWPGNTRELRNAVQRLLILNPGEEITEVEAEQALSGRPPVAGGLDPLFDKPLREARDQFERAYLEHHLARTGGNVAEVARLSEIERTHLYRKLKQLGVNPKPLKE